MDPSPTVAASAQQAARTKHGLVNVTRLVRALERMDQEEEDMSWLEVQKTWEVRYSASFATDGTDCAVCASTPAGITRLKRTVS